MTNLLALCLVFSTLLAAEVWSPSPTMTTHPTASEVDVIVKDGHHVVVVEYDHDGKTNTRVLISPPSADKGEEDGKVTSMFRHAKEKAKETVSYLPQVGQGISQPVMTTKDETEEARDHNPTAGEVICDAFGKCRQKIASVLGRVKDQTADTVEETASDAGGPAARKVHDVKETVARAGRDVEEMMADKAQYANEKVTEKAHELKESMGHKAHDAKEKVSEKAHEVKGTVSHKAHDAKDKVSEKAHEVKETVAHKAHELKETAAHKSQNAWERVKTAVRGFGSAMARALSPTKVASVVGLTAIAAAFGTCVWVTFVSSYVLASVLGRQQFGVLQSKLYPIYFKATSVGILVGLLGHVLSRRRKLLTDATEMWQGVNLLGSFFMIEANKSFIEPRATKAMFERMKAEKKEGRGGEREETSEQELRRKLETLSERLSKLNTYSSWLNILTLMSLTWHCVYLGQRLGTAC